MRSLLSLGLGAALALGSAPFAAGQAIVGYGINVGRAGAAGAAAGTAGAGAAGIFKNLQKTLNAEPEKKPSQGSTARRKPEFDKTDLKKPQDVPTNTRAKSASRSSGQVKTKSGIKISGITVSRSAPRRWAVPEPAFHDEATTPPDPSASQPNPSLSSASQPAPSAPPATDANPEATTLSEPLAASPEGGEAADSPQAQPAGSPGVLDARVATAYPNSPQAGAQVDAGDEPSGTTMPATDSTVGIFEGTPIDRVIERFGKPLLRMAGIPSNGYSEKYIFRTADGSRFTVLVQDGKVVRVLFDRTLDPTRASR